MPNEDNSTSLSISPNFPGLIFFDYQRDLRGSFRKVLSLSSDKYFPLRDLFWSESAYGVIRGMHYSSQSNMGEKLVSVIKGQIIDVSVDLRRGSTFGAISTFELSNSTASLLIPKGFGHGFQVTSKEPAIVLYATSNSYIQEFDSGVHPFSINFNWPIQENLLSERDANLPPINEIAQIVL